jgi:hypothetical protein
MALLPPSQEHGIIDDVDIDSKATPRIVAGKVEKIPKIVAVGNEGYSSHVKIRLHRQQGFE